MKILTKVSIYIGGYLVAMLALQIAFMIVNAIVPGVGSIYAMDLLLIVLFVFLIPSRICAKLDVYWVRRDAQTFEKEASKHGMTPGEYASTYFPPSLLDLCESNKNDKSSFEKLMKQCVEGETISKSDANVLRYMFRERKGL